MDLSVNYIQSRYQCPNASVLVQKIFEDLHEMIDKLPEQGKAFCNYIECPIF